MDCRKIAKEAWIDFGMLLIKGMTLPYRAEVSGRENIPEGKAILAANHTSFADPVFLVSGLNMKIYFLVKHYIAPTSSFENSNYGRLLASLDQILLKNGVIDKCSLKKALAVFNNDNKNNKLGIFPEGTRSGDGRLTTIHEGTAWISYLSKAPIVPIGIKGTYEIWPNHKKFPKLYGRVQINIGKPIYPDCNLGKKAAIKNLTGVIEKEISRLAYGTYS